MADKVNLAIIIFSHNKKQNFCVRLRFFMLFLRLLTLENY